MEILAYSHLATTEENSTVEPTFEAINWKKFSSLGMMGILSAATVLGSLNATANTASANCYDPCGGGYEQGYGRDGHRPKYSHASYKGKRRHRSYLKHGSRGYKVSKLQHQLGEMGYFHHHRATGYFGSKTKHAVKAFQRDHGLRPDGIVGPRTMSVLGDY